MKITTQDLVRKIREKSNGELKAKDITYVLKLLEDVTVEEVIAGNDVKLRSMFVVHPTIQEEFKGYDGITKQYYTRKNHMRVSVRMLGKLSHLDKK